MTSSESDTVCRFFFALSNWMQLIKPIILASRSPRRVRLLRQIGIEPEVRPPTIEEEFDPAISEAENAVMLALRKARAVAQSVDRGIVVGADTIVILDGELFAKPVHADDAKRMLRFLSGRTHTVITGFALVDRPTDREVSSHETTKVTFRKIPEKEIDDYVKGGSPLDKAGGYGIQDDYGAVFVTRIQGCFYNVVGFPLSKFYTTLEQFQQHVQLQ